MLSSSFTDMAKISAGLETFEQSVKYDEFGNTLKDASTSGDYEYSGSLYDGETIGDPSITEGIRHFNNSCS